MRSESTLGDLAIIDHTLFTSRTQYRLIRHRSAQTLNTREAEQCGRDRKKVTASWKLDGLKPK